MSMFHKSKYCYIMNDNNNNNFLTFFNKQILGCQQIKFIVYTFFCLKEVITNES